MAKQYHAPQQDQQVQWRAPGGAWGSLWRRGTRMEVEGSRFADQGLAMKTADAPWPAAELPALQPLSADQRAVAEEPAPSTLPTLGLERRLVRRAETIWKALRRGEPLPRLSDASVLLQPPFSGQAALVTRDDAGPRLSYVGSRLAALGLDGPGPLSSMAEPGAQLLAELALEAMDGARPALLASEDMAGQPGEQPIINRRPGGVQARRGGPALLLRAVALPFAGLPGSADMLPGEGAPAAILIASWREYLSDQDTLALHAELADAIGRLGPLSRC